VKTFFSPSSSFFFFFTAYFRVRVRVRVREVTRRTVPQLLFRRCTCPETTTNRACASAHAELSLSLSLLRFYACRASRLRANRARTDEISSSPLIRAAARWTPLPPPRLSGMRGGRWTGRMTRDREISLPAGSSAHTYPKRIGLAGKPA